MHASKRACVRACLLSYYWSVCVLLSPPLLSPFRAPCVCLSFIYIFIYLSFIYICIYIYISLLFPHTRPAWMHVCMWYYVYVCAIPRPFTTRCVFFLFFHVIISTSSSIIYSMEYVFYVYSILLASMWAIQEGSDHVRFF